MRFSTALKQNHIFRRLYAKGESCVGHSVVVYCRRNGLNVNRIGISVSKKLGHAVVRNYARRRLREVYRINESRFKPGYDIVLVARSRAVKVKFSILEQELLTQLDGLGIVKEAPV